MNDYEPATPRTALGAAAFALTLVTFGLFVAAPAALAARGGESDTCSAGALIAAASPSDGIRTLPAVEIVASRGARQG